MDFQKTHCFKYLKFIGIIYFIYIIIAILSLGFSALFQTNASYYQRLDFFIVWILGVLMLYLIPIYFVVAIIIFTYEKFKRKFFTFQTLNRQNLVNYIFVVLSSIIIPVFFVCFCIDQRVTNENIKMLKAYDKSVEKIIEDNWIIPTVKNEKDFLFVNFNCTISNEGLVKDIILNESSGYKNIDDSAINALKKSKLPKFPQKYTNEKEMNMYVGYTYNKRDNIYVVSVSVHKQNK